MVHAMASRISRDEDDLSFEEFCVRYGFPRGKSADVLELQDVIKDDGAFRRGLNQLNPSREPEITRKYVLLLSRQKLLSDKKTAKSKVVNPVDLSEVSGAKTAFSVVSKKTLFARAKRVSQVGEKLMKEIESLLELAIPASLVLPSVNGVDDKLRNDLLVTLLKKSEDIKTIVEIANKCIVKFKKIGTSRDINLIDPPKEAFNKRLGVLWKEAGHKVKTTVESEFDAFRNWSYQALSGKVHSSSTTSRGHAYDAARKFGNDPKGPARQEKLTESARNTVRFLKHHQHRPQVASVKLGDIEDDGEDLRKDIEVEQNDLLKGVKE